MRKNKPMRIDNDPATVDRLMNENLGMVRFTIKHFEIQPGYRQTWDELEASALYGLMRAAHTYNPTKGKFSTYAVRCILSYIKHDHDRGEGVFSRRSMPDASQLPGESLDWDSLHAHYDKEHEVEEHREVLRAVLARVPRRYRRLLQWKFLDGLPLAQVSEKSGISPSHLYTEIKRALLIARISAPSDTMEVALT